MLFPFQNAAHKLGGVYRYTVLHPVLALPSASLNTPYFFFGWNMSQRVHAPCPRPIRCSEWIAKGLGNVLWHTGRYKSLSKTLSKRGISDRTGYRATNEVVSEGPQPLFGCKLAVLQGIGRNMGREFYGSLYFFGRQGQRLLRCHIYYYSIYVNN